MKKLFVLMLFVAGNAQAAVWQNEIIEDGVSGAHVSFGLDRFRDNHAAYVGAEAGAINYAKWNGTQWLPEVIRSGFQSIESISLAVDQNFEIVMVGFIARAISGGTELYLARKVSSGSWSTELVSSSATLKAVTLSINDAGSPRMMFTQSEGGVTLLRYARYTGTQWVLSNVDRANDITAVSIVLDSTLNPHVSYVVNTSTGIYLKFAQFANALWQFQLLEAGASETSIVLAPGNNPRIAYTVGSQLKYAERVNGAWQTETALSTASLRGISLAIDPAVNPGISFVNGLGEVMFTRRMGTTWTHDIADALGRGTATAMKISGSGQIRIAYATNQSSVMFARTVTTDDTMPTISILSPANGATVSGTVNITGTAADDQSVPFTSIQIDNGAFIGANGNGNWSYSLNTVQFVNGDHTVTARSSDANGNLASTSITVNVQNVGGQTDIVAPTISILSPATGSTVSSTITISGTAADNVQLVSVAVSVDNGAFVNASGTGTWSFTLNTTGLSNASHGIVARAQDSSGNQATSGISINVSNSVVPPSTTTVWATEWIEQNASALRPVLIYDAARNPHAIYEVTGAAGGLIQLRYARWTGSAWAVESVDEGVGAFSYSSFALAFDSSGNPIVVYVRTGSGGNSLNFARRGTSGWTLEALPSGTQVFGGPANLSSVALALGNDSQPRIAFSANYGAGMGSEIEYLRYTGTEWRLSLVDSSTGTSYDSVSISMDSNRNPGIAYVAHVTTAADVSQLQAALWNGVSWNREFVAAIPAAGADRTSIAHDSANAPSIAYSFGNQVRLAERSANWSDQQADTAGTITGAALAFDGTNQPAISYAADGQLKVAVRAAGIWNRETLASNASEVTSIKGPALGIAYAVSGASGSGAKFAKTVSSGTTNPPVDQQDPTVAIGFPSNGASVSGTITISGTAADNVALSGVNISVDQGANQAVSGLASWTFSLDTDPLADGAHTLTATATDSSGRTGTASITVNVAHSTVTAGPLELSDLAVVELGTNDAKISWRTNYMADSRVDYGTSTAYGQQEFDPPLKTNHVMIVKNLCPNVQYHLRATSRDSQGQTVQSADVTLTTNKKKIKTMKVVRRAIEWEYDRDDGLSHFTICRSTKSYPTLSDNQGTFTVTSMSWEDPMAVPGVRHYYTVYPEGVFGNLTADPQSISSLSGSAEMTAGMWKVVNSGAGETITLSRCQVVVPAQSLASDMELSVQEPNLPENDPSLMKSKEKGYVVLGRPVDLGPDNLTFTRPVTLILAYEPAELNGVKPENIKVGFWNTQTQEWELLDSQADQNQNVVSAQTSHFSRYALLAQVSAFQDVAISAAYSYPNPVKDSGRLTFYVEAGGAETVDLRIYNDLGQKIHEAALPGPGNVQGKPAFQYQ